MPKLDKQQQLLMREAARKQAKKQSLGFQKKQLQAHADCYPENALENLVELSFERGKALQLISLGEHQDYQTLMRVLGVDFANDPRYQTKLAYFLVPDKTRYGRMQSALIWAADYILIGYEPNSNVLAHFQALQKVVDKCDWHINTPASIEQLNDYVDQFTHPIKQAATQKYTTIEAIDTYNQTQLKHYQLKAQSTQLIWLIISLHIGVGFASDPLWQEFAPILQSDAQEKKKISKILEVLIKRYDCFNQKDKE
jgi:hypothetical protein